ncbi:hypothetical protein QKS63_gp1 [Chestnut mosaic virus]|uniref:Uncharacterized protein n=1 Tax=Chestnut mosaic virus TaxID=2781948 RepID=A0AAE7NFB4_9VIRU|nr:hypothetical protein QKS63_gp1 [Chestnut mosaic virus]QOS14283.1 hypothetical protein [Chestnut mosaic virus]
MSESCSQKQSGREAFEKFYKNWERDPKFEFADLNYLDLAFPTPHLSELKNLSFYCFHRNIDPEKHSIGRLFSDPIQNIFVDFHLTGLFNQSVFYDRFKLFVDYSVEKIQELQEQIQTLEQQVQQISITGGVPAPLEEAPKPIEEETLEVLKKVEKVLRKVEKKLDEIT